MEFTTSKVQGSDLIELKGSDIAIAIELLTDDGKSGEEYRTYSFEFTARRHPYDSGACIVKDISLASWKPDAPQPWWKRIAWWVIGL